MKRVSLLVLLLAAILVLILGALSTVLATDQVGGKERVIFVHYAGGSNLLGQSLLLATDQVTDYKYSGIHWPSGTPSIHYKIDPTNSSGLTDTSRIQSAIDAAFTTWHNADKKVSYADDGFAQSVKDPLSTSDRVNSVSWRSLSSTFGRAIAVTATWYHRVGNDKIIDECDTVLNSDLPWSVNFPGTTGFDSYDVQDITTHETGHWLLLGDLYRPKDSELTMYGIGYKGETKKDSLGLGDIMGIKAIYP